MTPARRALSPNVWLLTGVLAVIVLAVYWPAATFDFVRWDDQINLTANPLLHPPSWGHIAEFWRRSYVGLYIPVTYTLWSCLAFWARVPQPHGPAELNPYLFHALNIVTHFLASLIVWGLLEQLLRRQANALAPTLSRSTGRGGENERLAAWFGAAFFALHPTCVEAAAWVTGFRDVLGGVLGFAALWAYISTRRTQTGGAGPSPARNSRARTPRLYQRENVYWYAISTILFLLAILAKPGAVAILPMAMVLDLLWIHRPLKSVAARLLPWAVATAVLAIATHRIQGSPSAIDVPPWWQRPLIAGDATSFYLGKMLLPIHLCVQYDHAPHRVLARGMAIMPTGIAVVAGVLIFLIGWRWRWVWVAGALFIAGLLPVLGLAPFSFQYYSTTADRYLYFALLGPAAAIAFILTARPRRWLYCLAGVLLCGLGVLSFQQVWTWRNTESIFRHVLRINPHSNLALVKLSREKLLAGDAPAAEKLARQALEARPDDSRAWVNLGAALEDLHHPREARNCYLHVVQTDSSPDSAGAYSNLAAMAAEGGDLAGAITLYHQALNHDPDLPEAQAGLTFAEQQLAAKK